VRIIAGTLRGRGLKGPGAGETSIRPTADRAREALFSILQKWPRGGFLDLCAGTGAVGLEAWSRGYAPVYCVEKEVRALSILEANLRGTGVQVSSKDIRRLPDAAFQDLAVIFADPPYEISLDLWANMASRIRPWLAPGGILVWETDRRTELVKVDGWDLLHSRHYGAACFHFLQAT